MITNIKQFTESLYGKLRSLHNDEPIYKKSSFSISFQEVLYKSLTNLLPIGYKLDIKRHGDKNTIIINDVNGKEYRFRIDSDMSLKQITNIISKEINLVTVETYKLNEKQSFDHPYVVIYSDGVRTTQGFNNINSAKKNIYDQIKTNTNLRSVELFRNSTGWNSTTQEQYLILWWSKGQSIWDNNDKVKNKKINFNLEMQLQESLIDIEHVFPDLSDDEKEYIVELLGEDNGEFIYDEIKFVLDELENDDVDIFKLSFRDFRELAEERYDMDCFNISLNDSRIVFTELTKDPNQLSLFDETIKINYQKETYTPGQGYRSDFDYKGLLSVITNLNSKSKNTFYKIYKDLVDINFHTLAKATYKLQELYKNNDVNDEEFFLELTNFKELAIRELTEYIIENKIITETSNYKNILLQIIDFVNTYKNTTLELYDDIEDIDEETTGIMFNTRENGDVGNEEYSYIDYNDAINMKKEIESKFPVKCDVEDVDEWVHLNINF